ncbi:MAG: ATP-binding protein [Gemmatimonadaceae bacterium]
MSTLRSRLTVIYAAALIGTLLVFAIALWAARRASSLQELQRYVFTEANLALSLVRSAELAGQPVTEVRDSVVGPAITPQLRTMLEGIPDYVLVLDANGRSLYVSFAARQLDPDELASLQQYAIDAPTSGLAAIVPFGGERLLMAARAPARESQISRVVVASSTKSAELAIGELVGTMLVIAPLLLLISIGGAYVIAGRALRPIDGIINEVQAITDGRSLHRRLPSAGTGDELERLTTTLNEMMERLERSFAALRRFTADASHELKTPLAVLRADVERAMTPNVPSGERLVALEEALHETTRMADLVESLLTLARADERRFDLHLEPVALEPLVRDVLETAVILGEAGGLTVTMPVMEPATVMGDAPRLRQLFLNLVTNAIKYTPSRGTVELNLESYGKTVAFSVRDTGIGIAAGDLPHIFERFWRADRARSRKVPSGERPWMMERVGFGLGLAIGQWIAEAHGGAISVRSRLGRGSTFTVTLPVAEPTRREARGEDVDEREEAEPARTA